MVGANSNGIRRTWRSFQAAIRASASTSTSASAARLALGRELIKHPAITLLMQLNKGYVVRCQLVIERRDSPTLFDLIEESLD
jgi:hypothetical protein